jgi:4-hydroxythreonine-4-phosphate dehydrogenase
MMGRYDAVICMYHDQALGPLKTVHFHDAINLTCGLPVPRISPDHGTAYDIAGKGVADPTSMVHALTRAERMAQRVQAAALSAD